ncbi:PepSY domain-containing protein [Curvivirga sp.]|uniref:PepSY domain-containing protein n=1 Tax=Curvivirga sp. TaxID=2856848 RepID=UPI003B59B6DA
MWKFILKTFVFISLIFALNMPIVRADDMRDWEVLALLDFGENAKGKFTLIDAIEKSFKTTPGIVERAEVDMDDGELFYEVEVSSGSSVYHFRYKAETGEVIYESIDSSATLANYVTLGLLTLSPEQEQTFMSKFLLASEQIEGGILSVELEEEDDIFYFEIRSWFENRLSLTLINAVTGKMIFIRNYENDRHGENLLDINEMHQVG